MNCDVCGLTPKKIRLDNTVSTPFDWERADFGLFRFKQDEKLTEEIEEVKMLIELKAGKAVNTICRDCAEDFGLSHTIREPEQLNLKVDSAVEIDGVLYYNEAEEETEEEIQEWLAKNHPKLDEWKKIK